uniref:Uncharacterized protein n=1 Tax=Aegilops tauschii subsp. strangulata TaxID=200361 RepID=A0A453JD91_AEGTS
LQWESKHIIAVSTAIQDWLTSRLALELMKQGAMRTVLSGFLAAFAWPATLLAATDFIDSKWSVAIDRSDKAGKMLADVLMKGSQGNRACYPHWVFTRGACHIQVLTGACFIKRQRGTCREGCTPRRAGFGERRAVGAR